MLCIDGTNTINIRFCWYWCGTNL